MRGAVCWSDHRLVRNKINIRRQTARQELPKNLNISRLPVAKEELQQRTQESLLKALAPDDAGTEWSTLRHTVYATAIGTLGLVQRSHKDWFDENDAEINELLDADDAPGSHLGKRLQEEKYQFQQTKHLVQKSL